MLDAKGDVLYVGKARSLKKRVPPTPRPAGLSERLRRMVALTAAMEFITTAHRGRGAAARGQPDQAAASRASTSCCATTRASPNLHPDRGPPLPADRQAPGRQRAQGPSYFGPVRLGRGGQPHAERVQKAFLLRSCRDSVFATRTRPCLLHQIKRCSAPCVGPIGQEDYGRARRARRGHSWPASRPTCRRTRGRDAGRRGAGVRARRRLRDRIRGADASSRPAGINPTRPDDADVIAACTRGRPGLRAGVLLPRRPQLRQPGLLPGARQGRGAGRRSWRPSSPSSTTTSRRRR